MWVIFLIEKVRGQVERAYLFTYFFNQHKIQKITQAMLFYTHAYASWEKGAIEHFNRIIRRFYPKRTDFSKPISKGVEILQEKLLNYPKDLHNSNRRWQHEDF